MTTCNFARGSLWEGDCVTGASVIVLEGSSVILVERSAMFDARSGLFVRMVVPPCASVLTFRGD